MKNWPVAHCINCDKTWVRSKEHEGHDIAYGSVKADSWSSALFKVTNERIKKWAMVANKISFTPVNSWDDGHSWELGKPGGKE